MHKKSFWKLRKIPGNVKPTEMPETHDPTSYVAFLPHRV